VLDPVQQAGGLLDARIDAANDAVKLFQSQMDDMDQRLTLREDYLRKQFSSLELALQQSQAQSSDLASRLASLPGA
jgi:flagellar capping protein FliD